MKKKNNIKIKKNSLEVKKNLEKGLHYYNLERYQESQLFLEKVLELDPVNFDAITMSSVIAYKTKNSALAAELALIGLNINPNSAKLHNHFSYVLRDLKLFDRAFKEIQIAIQLEPENPSHYKCRGSIYQDQEKFLEAKGDYERALKLKNNDELVFNNLGVVLAELKDYNKAIENYEKAINLKSDYATAYSNLSLVYQKLHQYEKAKELINKAISIDPKKDIFYTNQSAILNDNNELEEALKSLKISTELNPDNHDSFYNMGLTYLTLGHFFEGWKGYDHRWHVKSFNSKRIEFDKPILDVGQKADRLLIYGEQGLGDQILYSSLLPLIENIANRTIILVEKRLVELLNRSFPNIEFISEINSKTIFDQYLALGSLGKFFINQADDFNKIANKFLIANEAYSESLKKQLCLERKLLCGISWRSKSGKHGESKSLTLEDFLPLFNLPNIQFVNLQYGNVEEELKEFEHRHGIKILQCDSVDNMQDIDGLASLIEACDFVVTCSNTTTHIVGGLGKECYLMTPSNAGSLWYWGNVKDGRSLWYPSIQIFKQPSLNNWAGAMNLIVDKIKQKYLV